MKEHSPQSHWRRQPSNRASRGPDSAGGDAAGPDPGGEVARRRGSSQWTGPRWVVPVRSLVVVLAMVAAALGVLWIESAGVQNASAQLGAETAGKVAVPPLDAPSGADASAGSAGSAAPDGAAASAAADGSAPKTGPTHGAGSSQGPGETGRTEHSGESPEQGLVVVHVAGAVKTPGVFALDLGSRVFEAVEAAGGALPTAELAALNLAAPLLDGLQVFVPTQEQAAALQPYPGAAQAPGQSQGAAGSAPSGVQGKLNVNTASAAELETLPGVGPVLAERIVIWRTEHGNFASVDALDAVAGIGAKLLAGLRDVVTVS